MSDLNTLINNLQAVSGYVARQTNPLTGAPLPQPLVGVGSVAVPQTPPSPGQLSRGA